LCNELKSYLSTLTQLNLIRFWYDREIRPGDDWENEIAKQLEEADLILLLISAFFVESNYCFRREMARALSRHDEGTARVIPIYLRRGDYEGLPFTRLQGLPPGLVPVDSKRDHSKPLTEVSQAIRRERERLFAERAAQPAPPREAPVSELPTQEGELHAVELESYLRHLVVASERHARPAPRLSLAVEQVENGLHFANSVEALHAWAEMGAERVLLLTGEFGSGKTLTLRELVAMLARERIGGGSGVIPLFLTPQLLAYSVAELRRGYGEARAVIDEMLRGTRTIIVIDAIDETTVEQPAAVTLARLIESAPRSARFIVACGTSARAVIARTLAGSAEAITIYEMVPLSNAEVRRYLASSPKETEVTPAVINLARQPEVLHLLRVASKSTTLRGVHTLYGLCQAAVASLFRDVVQREASLSVTEKQLIGVCAEIAGQMFPRGAVKMERVSVDVPGATCEQIVSALVSVGILVIDAREHLSFAHATFFDYFFAAQVSRTLASWQSNVLAGINLIYAYNINRFLVPMLIERALAPRTLKVDPSLLAGGLRTAGCILTRVIRRADFASFVQDTGWRKQTGFGLWTTFEAPDGTTASSDGSLPERSASTMDGWLRQAGAATNLSWYDAMQFAIWAGGFLPTSAELRAADAGGGVESEWTSDWFDEARSLMSVWAPATREAAGFNPDFRSHRIGFRIVVPFVDP